MEGKPYRSFLCLALLLMAAHTGIARVPPPPRPPAIVDPNSTAFRTSLSRKLNRARKEALRTTPPVTMRFVVGWEMHYGYYLLEEHDLTKMITPDLMITSVRTSFDAEYNNEVLAKHLGERLICECIGVDWNFYSGRRFIVQDAKLLWVR